jgi:hypothetical protein
MHSAQEFGTIAIDFTKSFFGQMSDCIYANRLLFEALPPNLLFSPFKGTEQTKADQHRC